MAIYTAPIYKAKRRLEWDSEKLSMDAYNYALQIGVRTILNRQARLMRQSFTSDAEYQRAAMEWAKETLQDCYKEGPPFKRLRMVWSELYNETRPERITGTQNPL